MTRSWWGAAAGIAGVTAASRIVGFARIGILSRTLGTSCLGDTYSAANAIPNVVFEVVAGGALASVIVPVLAGAVAASDQAAVNRICSALLTWTALVLVPVTVLGLLAAPYLLRAVTGTAPSCGRPMLLVGTRMLVVFLPQVVLYGVGIVLAGILQAHRRFLGPALAPLLSSLVVIAAYLLYAEQGRPPLRALPRGAELTLSAGTTLGVVVLALGLLVPLRRCGLSLRPSLQFPAGVAARVRRLALAGLAGLAAQQLALVVSLRLAAGGREGAVVVLQVATALFLLPWAVLAVPIATAAFPRLAATSQTGRQAEYDDVAAQALVGLVVATLGATAVLVAVAEPAGRLLVAGAPGPGSARALAQGVTAFAPGLIGYGILALIGRALYARGDGRTPAVATVAGWLTVAVVDLILVDLTPMTDRVVALGIGNSVGMTTAGLLLLRGLRRVSPAALTGAGRAATAGLLGCLLGVIVSRVLPGFGASIGASLLSAVVLACISAGIYLAVVQLVQPGALRTLLRA